MNLRVNRFFAFAFYTIFVLVLISCKESKRIGKEVQPAGNELDVFFTDTFDIETSTILIDTVNTRYAEYLFLGGYNDPEIGTIRSTAYTQLYLANNGLRFDANSVADSMVVNILGFSTYYGDTTKSISLDLYRLASALDTSIKYTSKSDPALESSPMASLTFFPTIKRTTDTLKLKLSGTLASEIVAASGTGSLDNSYNFNQLVKGIAFKTTSSNASMLGIYSAGFNGTRGRAYTRLYYHVSGETTQKFVDFYFTTGNLRFNKIESSFSGPLAQLTKTGDSLPSSLASNKCYVQPNVGLATKLTFTGLEGLLALKGKIIITKVDLQYQSSSDLINMGGIKYLPPSGMCLYQTDASNKLLKNSSGVLIRVQQEFQSNVSTPAFGTYNDANYVVVNHQITSYFQDLVYNPTVINRSLVIYPLIFSNSFSRYVLFDNKHASTPMKLKVYYTRIE